MTTNRIEQTIPSARRAQSVGEYYFSRKLAEVRSLDSPGKPVINLGIGSPDLAPSTETVESLVEAARRTDTHAYQSYRGVPALREEIARFHSDVFGAALDPTTEILPLMGSKEGILHISLAFVDEGDEVLVPDPGYPTYTSVTKLVGGNVRTYAVRPDADCGIDFDALERSDLSRVKLMWINFPHMPTGKVATRAGLERLLDIARRNRFLLVNDNPYAMIGSSEPLSLLSIEGARDVALELGSLSKSHNMAGWRIGWVAGAAEHVDLVLRVRSNMDSGMFLPVQLAAAKALESREEWFEELNATYSERRRKAEEIAHTLGCAFEQNQAGLFVWAKAPDRVADVEAWLDKILRDTKVFITPGFIFGDGGTRHLRLSLCNPIDLMDEAKHRLDEWSSLIQRAEAHPDRGDTHSEPSDTHPEPSQTHGELLPAHPERSEGSSIDDRAAKRRIPSLSDPSSHSVPGDGSSQSAARNPRSTVTVIGLGLIGGSMAIDLKRQGFASRVIGIDTNHGNAELALRRGLVDEIGELATALPDSDVVILAIPVDDIESIAPSILDAIGEHTVVIDTGSTKRSICESLAQHRRRSRFVPAHPIAGTENSGPEAAFAGLFAGKINIFCERDRCDAEALRVADELFASLGMRSVFMGAREHDLHLAYVSHLSHVTSFVLGQTVLDIENDEKNIFLLAGSGFASTVRLAKSSPAMWAPIFDRNATFLTKALDEYIIHLQRFRQALTDRDVDRLESIMAEANEIRRVLSNMQEPRSADGSSAGARASSPCGPAARTPAGGPPVLHQGDPS